MSTHSVPHDGEDETSFNRHIKVLQAEFAKPKSRQNLQIVDDLMKKTFLTRRQEIIENSLNLNNLFERFPFLKDSTNVSLLFFVSLHVSFQVSVLPAANEWFWDGCGKRWTATILYCPVESDGSKSCVFGAYADIQQSSYQCSWVYQPLSRYNFSAWTNFVMSLIMSTMLCVGLACTVCVSYIFCCMVTMLRAGLASTVCVCCMVTMLRAGLASTVCVIFSVVWWPCFVRVWPALCVCCMVTMLRAGLASTVCVIIIFCCMAT